MQSISITNSPTDSKLESSPQSESCSETEDDANSAEIQEAKQFLLQHQYDLFTDRSVGNGSYGKVYVVKHLTEKKLYVAKIVALDANQDLYTQLKQMVREIRVLKILKNHPNIVQLKEVFSDYKVAAPSCSGIDPSNPYTPPPSSAAPSYSSHSNAETAAPSYSGHSNAEPAAASGLNHNVKASAAALSTLYLVFEQVDTDLHKVIHSRQYLTNAHIKVFMYQLLCALSYMHSIGIIHRDIKPSNILITGKCTLKLCDFGMCRFQISDLSKAATSLASPVKSSCKNIPQQNKKTHRRTYTPHVVTRWYRPPEISLSTNHQSTAIDIWSTGCIFAELLFMLKESQCPCQDRRAFFPGKTGFPFSGEGAWTYRNQSDQLNMIFDILGTPSESDVYCIDDDDGREYVSSLMRKPARPLTEKFAFADPQAVDLLKQLLMFNPSKRVTAQQALNHSYLKDVRDSKMNMESMHFQREGEELENKLYAMSTDELVQLILDEIASCACCSKSTKK